MTVPPFPFVPSSAGSLPPEKPKRARRNPSPGARFFSSKRAVDDHYLATVYRWDTARVRREFARLRWGDDKLISCPHCNTQDEHPWYEGRENWRCMNNTCRRFFSVTTNTLLDSAQRSLRDIYVEAFLWASSSAGTPALTVRAMAGTASYNTSYSLIQKLREGLARGHNPGLIAGVVEIDGAHASGHNSAERRGKPLAQQKPKNQTEQDARDQSVIDLVNKKQAKRAMSPEQRQAAKAAEDALFAKGQVRDPNTGAILPHNRRMVMTLRRRTGNPGDGSVWTKVGVGMSETPEVAEYLAQRHVLLPESILATDFGVAFIKLGKKFRLHTTVNHSQTLVGPAGEHVNMAESFTARQDRAEAGIYLNIEPKYLHEYACETAFREDHRRVSPKLRTEKLLFWALNVGKSQYWRNYTAGQNRKFEELVPERLPAGSSSGPEKHDLTTAMKGRPPR